MDRQIEGTGKKNGVFRFRAFEKENTDKQRNDTLEEDFQRRKPPDNGLATGIQPMVGIKEAMAGIVIGIQEYVQHSLPKGALVLIVEGMEAELNQVEEVSC